MMLWLESKGINLGLYADLITYLAICSAVGWIQGAMFFR